MISFDDAKQIALDKIGPECALFEDEIIEKPYGWYFCYQSKAYVASGDLSDFLVGSGGFIVEREDGRIFNFGSAFTLERNLAAYEAGFRFELYDLTITRVFNLEETVALLHKLNMTYVISEVENGTVWRIPREFSKTELRTRLTSLPHTFAGHNFYFRVEVFGLIDAAECCDYHLEKHNPNDGEDTV